MKKLRIFPAIVIFLALPIFFSCGEKPGLINLDTDGYGRTTLDNGITVLINHDEMTSLTAARILIGGGVLTETAENNGITNLMTRMLLKGNAEMTADEITERLDFLGANISIDCFRDYSAISFVSLSENFEEVLAIISKSVISPVFPEEELVKLKHEIEGNIKASDDNQSQASDKLFWRTIYGNQGYGLPTPGTIETVNSVMVDDIKEHYQKYIGGRNIIFSVSTDLPADLMMNLITGYLGTIKQEAETIPAPSLVLQKEKEGFISNDRNQSFIYMGAVLDHPAPREVASLGLLNEIMGGTTSSRLWYLRQKEKLAYTIYTQYRLDKYDAVFRAAIGTDTSKVSRALASLNREWAAMVKEGITETELADARVNMKNTLIYYIDRKSNRTNNMAYYEYIGYGYRFVTDLINMADDITMAELNTFIGTNFTEQRKFTSVVGKM